MALKDIQIPKVEVEVAPGSSFAVRGLSTTDIEVLVRRHGDSLRELFTEYVTGPTDLSTVELGPVLKQLLSRAPAIVIDVVAVCADADDEDTAVLRKLPAAIQINALVAIFGLTLTTEGDMGKALETAIKVLGGANGGMAELLKGLTAR